jgi:VIT1/CCC1 family predicted Fe2+/Mn2+ transporter
LKLIAQDEKHHYDRLKQLTGVDVKPNMFRIRFYTLISRLLGYTFGIKLMEQGEEDAKKNYSLLISEVNEARDLLHDEIAHEESLIAMLDEETLRYAGSIVLGLSDALVELTGALAGFTLALQNTNLIALSGLITGVAATMSMAASEYLSTSADKDGKNPVRSALYTGVAYLFTVAVLILPYLILDNYFVCLAISLSSAVLIIAGFNYYISVARDESFRKRFFEMAGISMGVSVLSFIFGYVIRNTLGIEI